MFVTPKFCRSIVFSFSWELKRPQEKLKTMLMQNFGVTNKEYCDMLWYFLEWSIIIINEKKAWVTLLQNLIILYKQMYWHLLQRLCASFYQREPQAKSKWANQRTSLLQQLLRYNIMYSPDRQEIVLREKGTRILIKYWEKLIQELQMFVSYRRKLKTL